MWRKWYTLIPGHLDEKQNEVSLTEIIPNTVDFTRNSYNRHVDKRQPCWTNVGFPVPGFAFIYFRVSHSISDIWWMGEVHFPNLSKHLLLSLFSVMFGRQRWRLIILLYEIVVSWLFITPHFEYLACQHQDQCRSDVLLKMSTSLSVLGLGSQCRCSSKSKNQHNYAKQSVCLFFGWWLQSCLFVGKLLNHFHFFISYHFIQVFSRSNSIRQVQYTYIPQCTVASIHTFTMTPQQQLMGLVSSTQVCYLLSTHLSTIRPTLGIGPLQWTRIS